MRPCIILFAKAPLPGRVKTRLVSRISPKHAAELHTAFVSDMLDLLSEFADAADIELHTDVSTDAWCCSPVARRLQHAGTLGDRMRHALDEALRRGHERVLIIGSDAPTLPASHLTHLLRSESEVALGPAEDGGYYAISCRRTHPRMFDGVVWSGPAALKETVDAARRCGLSVAIGEPWYDVDTPADLEKLSHDPGLRGQTARMLRVCLLTTI